MTQFLQNAAHGTAIILAAALLRRILKDRLIPEARLALWAVCLFRLLTPAAPQSVLSLWRLSQLLEPEQKPVTPVSGTPYVLPAAGVPATFAPQPGPAISWETVLFALWLTVGTVLVVRYVLSWTRTWRAVARATALDRTDVRYVSLPKCARLRESAMEGAPLTFGAVRPIVVLSPGLEGEALDCVLAHEGVHASRRDNLWHYAMALVLSVYWWNPAVWLMSRLLRRDIELACDRAALRLLGADRRAEYANTLVSLATQSDEPEFVQSFGRKAVEERILSIMKFKKTSVIGVIFTLALVLAVSVAFASEPKAADDTVTYHGRTYNRASLSQATLDWLDWYSTLSEEGQLAVSMVPPELISDENPTNYDVQADDEYSSEKVASHKYKIVSVPDIEAIKDIQSDLPEVAPDDVDLDRIKALLDRDVADGKIPQEAADSSLNSLLEMIDRARRGEAKLVMDEDGWVYGMSVNKVYYQDEDGNLIPWDDLNMDPYVIDSRPIDSQPISGYEVCLPEFDEDGNPVNNGIIGQGFISYDLTDPDGTVVGGVPRNSDGTLALCDTEDCQFSNPHWHQNGSVVYAEYQNPYEDSPNPAPAVTPLPGTDLIPAMGTNGELGYVRESDMLHGQYERLYGPINNPNDAMKYMAWLETQPDSYTIPLYDAKENVIGEFQCGGGTSPSVPDSGAVTYPVCAAAGCTTAGLHTHNGTTYCGGEGHHGDTCDGSCINCTQQSAAAGHHSTPNLTTNSLPQQSSGHHSSSHHSGHH